MRLMESWVVRTYLFFRRLPRAFGSTTLPVQPKRVLICKSCCLGDALLSLYAIRDYRKKNPDVVLDVLGSARVESIYRNSPDIDQVFSLPVTGRNLLQELLHPRFWLSAFSTLRRLRARRYDCLFDLELYRGYGAILPVLLNIPYSRGFRVEGTYSKGHNELVDRPKDEPEWRCFYPLFEVPFPESDPEPLFTPKARGKSDILPLTTGKRRIGLVYGSSFNWPQKKWPISHFVSLIRLLDGVDFEFVLLGSDCEKDEAAYLCRESGFPLHNLSGKLDFEGLLDAVAECDLVVGNDTGTMHVAGALGIPALTLFGPTNPLKWRGLSARSLYRGGLPCRPCYYLSAMPACPHRNCLQTLEPARVATEIKDFCNQEPISLADWTQNLELG